MAEEFRVFISAVSSEFGEVRNQIGADLRARDMVVREQKDFHHSLSSNTTLRLLNEYVSTCAAVICIIGQRGGAKPPPASAKDFDYMLPPGIAEATYTHWEFIFARHYKRTIFAYVAKADYVPDREVTDGENIPELHRAFRHYLFDEQDAYRMEFSTRDELREDIRKADWEPLRVTVGWSQQEEFVRFLDRRRKFFYGRNWVFDQIKTWHDKPAQEERLFLITGLAGTGKSAVIARFLKQPSCGQVIASHCFMHSNDKTLRLDGFVRNFAYGLAQQIPDYRQIISSDDLRSARADLDSSSEHGPGNFFRDAIIGPLANLGRRPDLIDMPAWMVLDALDEAAEDEEKKNIILDLVSRALKNLPPWIRVLATSRPGELARQLGEIFDEGAGLVREVSLDAGEHPEDTAALVDYIDARVAEARKAMPAETRALLLERSERNFLYLTHVLDGFQKGTYQVEEIRRLPPSLPEVYSFDFRRIFRGSDKPDLKKVKRLFAALVAARTPLPLPWLGEIIRVPETELSEIIARFLPYLSVRNGSYAVFHKSFEDWLLQRAGKYAISRADGHKLMADFCRACFAARREGVGDLSDRQQFEDWRYLVRYGVEHFVAAGAFADAVDLLHFIKTKWHEERMGSYAFKDVAPDALTRRVLSALEACPAKEGRKIDPSDLKSMLPGFYQVGPLKGPVKILIRDHPRKWPATLKGFLKEDNYVLRYVISRQLAGVYLDAGERSPVTLEQIDGYLKEGSDVNMRELGAYAFAHIYGRDDRLDVTQPEHLARLERMGRDPSYGVRSALGDLMVNLALQDRFDYRTMTSAGFWKPIWDHNWIDVWDVKAASMRKGPLPDGADADTKAAYDDLRRTLARRDDLIKLPEIRNEAALFPLLTNLEQLGQEPAAIGYTFDQTLFEKLSCIPELMRVIFGHPLWNVGEEAASELTTFIERNPKKQSIIPALWSDPCWRVTFGAIETAYQLTRVGDIGIFGTAVENFFEHPNSRVRALCAENLIAYILDRPSSLRMEQVDRYRKEIQRWIGDDDAWVLEHVFRLLTALAKGGADIDALIPKPVPYLLDGLNDWVTLSRATFLTHIEDRQRKRLSRPA